VLHVEPEALKTVVDSGAATGQAALDDGPYVSCETSQRLACDAALVVMEHAADGAVLDVGRKTRTIPPAIRRALTARDTRCRFPGCTARHCDAHHVRHWAVGGATRLDNLVLLCRRHHALVHEGGWSVGMRADGAVEFSRPDGSRLETTPAPPPRPYDASPLAPINARLAAAGITIGPHSATPVWYGERLDVGWAIDVLRGKELHDLMTARVAAEGSPEVGVT
jgi:hypothetical protein